MIIEEPTNIELVDVNGKRKKALGKVRNVEISLGGKCVTKMTLQVTDATSYNLILGNDWLTQIHALINTPNIFKFYLIRKIMKIGLYMIYTEGKTLRIDINLITKASADR